MARMFSASRSVLALLVLVSLLLLMSSGHLFASEEVEGAKKGLLDPDTETFIYTVVVFLLAFWILQKKAWGPISAALDEREKKIRESLEAADRMREEQQAFQAEQEKVLAKARKEASAIVAEGKRDAEVVRDQVVNDAKTRAEEIKTRALSEIDQAKEKAVDEIHTRAVGLSITIAEKLIGHSVNEKDQDRIAKDTISEYEKIN
ncbi:MAG: F0F1 ATP synthase subunit B [Planctomycetes bacterium]|nr:F0F1 ATP synthase subunit B [Planctomycetota bacterium]